MKPPYWSLLSTRLQTHGFPVLSEEFATARLQVSLQSIERAYQWVVWLLDTLPCDEADGPLLIPAHPEGRKRLFLRLFIVLVLFLGYLLLCMTQDLDTEAGPQVGGPF